MIRVTNITKKYGKKVVLDNINLTIQENERIAIMGLNGSGKTTLSEIILKIFKPTSGTIEYQKQDLVRNATFQDGSFDNELNLTQLIDFYAAAFQVKVNKVELLTQYELLEFAKQKYSKLSGGQRQKFRFLITLMNQPNLLLLDELTTSLDYIWREKIVKLVKNFLDTNPCTLLIVSHNKDEIAGLCNRAIVLSEGKIIKDFSLPEDKTKALAVIDKEIFNYDGNI
ncbi:ABC transporter ATP-binding protein [Spiroplasma clarkii]|uniref:ABC transporter ATP-binding protein n=1 Tax=Spiroplasma clarkii TaxID=2139 RepID=A0A1Y0L1P9_9MOLU|nr:ABC transporter ATP-binding protein [Spiroplasma clarkii]ARU91921.1 ABC transporter ATP-binding protein [Spiroplasma clarkii]ATX71265.1 ABC transporter ATP-binding protein [Spiroplasma clarkii]